MTTHDHHTETTPTLEAGEPATAITDDQTAQTDSSTRRTGPSTAQAESSTPGGELSVVGTDAGQQADVESSLSSQTQPADAQPSTAHTESALAGAESSPERSLFADDELAGLRARWDTVQAGFVDDPKGCVVTADGLVSDLVDQLTTGLTKARARLEQQWDRGEEASTEDLRLALKHYREFFQRLLAV